MTDSIVWGDTPEIAKMGASEPFIRYCTRSRLVAQTWATSARIPLLVQRGNWVESQHSE